MIFVLVHTMVGTVDPAEVRVLKSWDDAYRAMLAQIREGPSEGMHDWYEIYTEEGEEKASVDINWEDRIMHIYGAATREDVSAAMPEEWRF